MNLQTVVRTHAGHRLVRAEALGLLLGLGASLLLATATHDAVAATPLASSPGVALTGDAHDRHLSKPCYSRKTQAPPEAGGSTPRPARLWLVHHCVAPSDLVATADTVTLITLTWTPPTLPATGYRVERCQGTGCTSFVQIATPTATTYHDTGLTPNTLYRYRVRAADAAGQLSPYSPIAGATTLADTTPPAAPASLTATASSTAYQIALSWPAATDDVGVTGYRLERCQGTGCSTFALLATVTTLSFTDTPLTPSTAYTYRVRATDAAGNLGPFSPSATATTIPDTTPPTAPTALTATVVSLSQINLSWTAATDDVGVTGYAVERCQGTGCSTFAPLTTTSAVTVSDGGLSQATTYSYRVRATDAAGNLSVYSTTASATVPPPPTPPANLSATAASPTQITLAWTASVGVDHYDIERSVNNGPYAVLGTSGTTSFADTSVTPGTVYLYRVRAEDAAGNLSEYSPVATAAATLLTIQTTGVLNAQYGGFADDSFFLQAPNGTSWRITVSGTTGSVTNTDGLSGNPLGRALLAPNGKVWDFSITSDGVLVVTERP